MIQATIFELLEGLKIFYKYDGNPEIKSYEGKLRVKISSSIIIKKHDVEDLARLRWANYENSWSLTI